MTDAELNKAIVDWENCTDQFTANLAELGLHLMEHQFVMGWEDSVAEISYALTLWDDRDHAIDKFDRNVPGSATAVDDEERRLWVEFWSYVSEHMQDWWD